MKRLALAVLATALVPAAAAQAGPKYYFTCSSQTKVEQTGSAAWSADAPAASYQSGAGCGSGDIGLEEGTGPGGNNFDFFGGGSYTGAIDTITLELHSLLLSQARA